VVKAGDSCDVLARNDLGEPVIASPAISDNTTTVRVLKRVNAKMSNVYRPLVRE
jgi:hypothetical protein